LRSPAPEVCLHPRNFFLGSHFNYLDLHFPIMAGSTLEITDANFAEVVEQSTVPVLVDFWAEWCGPCKAIGPVIDQVADEAGEKFKVGKVDVMANPDLAQKFGVRAIPLILFFKDGEVKDKITGAVADKGAFLSKLEALA